MIKTLLPVLVLAFLGAPAWGSSIEASYRCNDGTRVNATFKNPKRGPSSVVLVFPKTGKKMVLPQGMSADGGRYASGTKQFWVKGNSATLTRSGRDVTCRTKS